MKIIGSGERYCIITSKWKWFLKMLRNNKSFNLNKNAKVLTFLFKCVSRNGTHFSMKNCRFQSSVHFSTSASQLCLHHMSEDRHRDLIRSVFFPLYPNLHSRDRSIWFFQGRYWLISSQTSQWLIVEALKAILICSKTSNIFIKVLNNTNSNVWNTFIHTLMKQLVFQKHVVPATFYTINI